MRKAIPSLIQVLWVEDDPEVTETYPLEAAELGLQLVPFPCWDDAEMALKSEFDRWSAIILDAKCKQHKDSTDNAPKFLSNALLSIERICNNKKRSIPWYVLSGGAENEIADLIPDTRKEWDNDWPKFYYEKATDREMLYRRVKVHARKSPSMQIHAMYQNVFDAIEQLGLSDDVYNLLEDLLIPIHFPEVTTDKEYNDKFKNARIITENIFRSMMDRGILPKSWKVNLQWNNLILSGKDVAKKDANNIERKIVISYKRILPKILCETLKSIIFTANADVHSRLQDDDRMNTPEYLESVGNTSYLLKSLALQLCDVILWYKGYLCNHPDKEENCKNWEIVDDKAFNNR